MIISATIRKAGPSKAWERREGGREASEFPSCRGGGGGRRGRGGGGCWSTNWTPAAWQYNYGLLPRARGCVCVCACVSRGFGPWREHAIPALRGFFDRPVEKLASCRHPLRPSAISLPFLVLSFEKKNQKWKGNWMTSLELNRIKVVIWGILEFAGRKKGFVLFLVQSRKRKNCKNWRKAFRNSESVAFVSLI